jgi:DNA-binding IclR family transcriptional regulator
MRINRSTARTIDILKLLSIKGEPLTLAEISKFLEFPKSSTFDIIKTLMAMNIIEYDNVKFKTFRIGLGLFEIALLALGKMELHREARHFLDYLLEKTGETIFLALEDNGEVVYLDKAEGKSAVRFTAELGTRRPMHCTGLGKALLAAYPEKKVKEIIKKKKLPSFTENTITRMDDLMSELKASRERGYSIDNEECIPDVFCVSSPIKNRFEKPIAAISIATSASKMTAEMLEEFGTLVSNTALDISRKLGFRRDRIFFD